MTKHTQKEWETRIGAADRVFIKGDKSKASQICICIAQDQNLRTSTEDFANAKLIASAPKLLEACKKAQLYFDQINFRSTEAKLIEQAINQAEGK